MIRDLGGGLVLRRGTPADAEALAAFNADVLRPQDASEPSARFAAWTRDLMTGRHPTFTPADATVVENTRTGAIVSSILLITQTWSFGGIAIEVGQLCLRLQHPIRGLWGHPSNRSKRRHALSEVGGRNAWPSL